MNEPISLHQEAVAKQSKRAPAVTQSVEKLQDSRNRLQEAVASIRAKLAPVMRDHHPEPMNERVPPEQSPDCCLSREIDSQSDCIDMAAGELEELCDLVEL